MELFGIIQQLDTTPQKVYNYTQKGDTMGTVRLNITLPTSLNNDINRYAEELNEKKSHIIASALDVYFDYLDLRVAEKRLEDKEPTLTLDEMKKELGI